MATVSAAIVSAAIVVVSAAIVVVSAAIVSAARWRAGYLDDADAAASTSVGGTSLGAPVSRLALSGRPPRPLLMRIACSISLSYSVRVHSRPAGGRAGSWAAWQRGAAVGCAAVGCGTDHPEEDHQQLAPKRVRHYVQIQEVPDAHPNQHARDYRDRCLEYGQRLKVALAAAEPAARPVEHDPCRPERGRYWRCRLGRRCRLRWRRHCSRPRLPCFANAARQCGAQCSSQSCGTIAYRSYCHARRREAWGQRTDNVTVGHAAFRH